MMTHKDHGKWVEGDQLFRVGFHIEALPAAKLMSGNVEVHDVIWLNDQDAVLFIVSRKNMQVFEQGGNGLKASRIGSYRRSEQPILVERTYSNTPIERGRN